MWTTSSSHADGRRRLRSLPTLPLACLLGALGCAEEVPPDTPAPALEQVRPERPEPIAVDWAAPVELVGADARVVDDELRRLAPAAFLEGLERPIAILVTVRNPIDPTPRDAFPVVEVNGRVVEMTRVRDERTLVAFLPDDRSLDQRNQVFVFWVGAERRTRSPEPVFFSWPLG